MGVTLTDVLLFGKAQLEDVDSAALVIYRRNVLRWGALGGYLDVIVKGVAPLSLLDAIADSLQYIKAYGGTIQGVPAGYTMLDSVSNRTQSTCDVNTGVYVDVDDVEIEIQADAKTGSWYIFQSQKTQSAAIWGISGANSGAKISFNWGGLVLQSNISRTSGNTYYVKATAKNGNATLYVKDITNNVEDTVTDTYTYDSGPTSWFGIFGTERNPSLGAGNVVYYVKMSVGGKQVLDAIPAQRQSDSTNGFYNKINGQFLIPEELTALNAGTPIVPTPTAPIDITCNNGVLKCSKNLANMVSANIVDNYYIDNNGNKTANTSNFYYGTFIAVKPNTSYTISRNDGGEIRFVSMMEYDSAKTFIQRTLSPQSVGTSYTFTTGANTAYILWGSNPTNTNHTVAQIIAMNWQVEEGSTATQYAPYKTIYLDGLQETIAIKSNGVTGSTAVAEMLLKVGDYQDVQSIIDGAVTRNVGVKVLDGTETISASNTSSVETGTTVFTYTYVDLGITDILDNNELMNTIPYPVFLNTHFTKRTAPIDNNFQALKNGEWGANGVAPLYRNKYLILASNQYTTEADFKQWLANQYAAGTPVIIVYPLAVPTTETVTAQPMETVQGDNTAEITQASMGGLELEVKYQAEVS